MSFSDCRSSRVVLVSHCLLNANVKVCGLARYNAVHSAVADVIAASGCGIVQLPCPEFLFLGLKRWWQSKAQYDTPAYRRHCAMLAESVVDQVVMYRSGGVDVAGFLAVEGSPSCGLSQVYDHPEWGGRPCDVDTASAKCAGRGIWMEELLASFDRRGILATPLYGVGSEADEAAVPEALRSFLAAG
ncbi:2-thiouracil desulfurase family protein [Desulfovibrio mangrovi]|uniref:CD3072 family TudS-related putative desulfidase n=1 Tax=Desulfovibrio mangrovi TaxID=2976983 RepID=UPI0022468100|nr:CD3072 family TudS-related putative desulfidase [Desulfovibrio mangrovi]UZP67127.1 2-thiouracil desulfurase family protein [Desulfovibrio mangrovi]